MQRNLRRSVPLIGALLAAALVAGCGGAAPGASPGGGSGGAPPATTVAPPPTAPAGSTALGSTAPIVVTQPERGATVHAPVRFAGTADVFEATVSVELLGADGRKLAETYVTASCGSGCRGSYAGSISPPDGYDGRATLRLFERSAEDGSQQHVVEVPLTIAA
jgi:hypothetical protein